MGQLHLAHQTWTVAPRRVSEENRRVPCLTYAAGFDVPAK